MISKERELLKKALELIDHAYEGNISLSLCNEIKELLDKPEQATLKLRESSATKTFNNVVNKVLAFKPVAWKGKTYGNLHHVDYGNSIPLYTSPPTREPLSDEEIEAIWGQDSLGTTAEFVRAIEKAHGIGVGDE